MAALTGTWNVRRTAGVLLPFGIRKRIGQDSGWTLIGRVPVAFFRVLDNRLRYVGLPIEDILEPGSDGGWNGRGLLFGREFCRFRLEPR
jgi:hypothetical protein